MYKLGASNIKRYQFAGLLVRVMPFAIAFLAWLNGQPSSQWLDTHPSFERVLIRTLEYSVYAYGVFWALYGWGLFYRWLGDPWAVKKLQFILDEYQNGAFEKAKCPLTTPKDHNRVTLFRYRQGWQLLFRKPRLFFSRNQKIQWFSSYLAPVLRSDHLSKKSEALFFVGDSSDEAEGVVGQAWVRKAAIDVSNLPKMNKKTTKTKRNHYIKETWSNPNMVEQHINCGKDMPMAIVAIPVECKGELWGVVVLDSRYPEGLSRRAVDEYQMTVTLIGHLLERAS